MIFTETRLKGAHLIDVERKEDSRGYFARTFCQNEFDAHGLQLRLVQTSIAHNDRAGTVRGLHFQYPPAAEIKLIRCIRGAILDFIVDLRPESPTFLQHIAIELSEDNQRAVYVPKRFAHGYQTLRDNCDVAYEIGEFYSPGNEGGIAHNDPRLKLAWPLPVSVISERDRNLPTLDKIEDVILRRMRG